MLMYGRNLRVVKNGDGYIETIAVIRDLSIIVVTVSLTLFLIVLSIWLFRLYRSVKRILRNVEEGSSIILTRVIEPLSALPTLTDIGGTVIGFFQRFISKDGRGEEDGRE